MWQVEDDLLKGSLRKKKRDDDSSSDDEPKRPNSPSAVARALEVINKRKDSCIPDEPHESVSTMALPQSIYDYPEKEVFAEQSKLEKEMSLMF